MNLAAEYIGKFTADRAAEASAAVLSIGAGVGLLKSFKNKPLILIRDAESATSKATISGACLSTG